MYYFFFTATSQRCVSFLHVYGSNTRLSHVSSPQSAPHFSRTACFFPWMRVFVYSLPVGLQRAPRALTRLFVEFERKSRRLNSTQEAKMRFPAYLLPILQPRNSLRCISGVNIEGTHSIVGYTSPSFPPFPFAEVCALQSAPPLPSPPSPEPP